MTRGERQTPDPRWKRLAPGVYEDEGTVHLYIHEMLRAAGYADTPANRAALIVAAERTCAELGIELGDES